MLWDRRIVRPNELHSICPKAESLGDCFRNVKNSVATCRWLDETFNGDLLPLSGGYTAVFNQGNEQTGGSLFLHLQAILEGWKHVGAEGFQLQIDWGDLDFAHIPIGVLSQVYENFSKIWDPQEREQTSAYYTPKNIARYLVDDAFEGLSEKKNARILDPSCGARDFPRPGLSEACCGSMGNRMGSAPIQKRSSPFFTISFAVLMSMNPPCVWRRCRFILPPLNSMVRPDLRRA